MILLPIRVHQDRMAFGLTHPAGMGKNVFSGIIDRLRRKER